jgi:hypothetical protein
MLPLDALEDRGTDNHGLVPLSHLFALFNQQVAIPNGILAGAPTKEGIPVECARLRNANAAHSIGYTRIPVSNI